jgi:type II secretory pathway pseudopilin PulG
MVVVVGIISLMAAVSFPAITSGIDSLRLNEACNGVVAFLNSGLNQAQRREQVIEVTISPAEKALLARSADSTFNRRFDMPEGITIYKILPELPSGENPARVFMLYPGGTVPQIGVQLVNRRHASKIVRVDPMTGVPAIEQVAQPAEEPPQP